MSGSVLVKHLQESSSTYAKVDRAIKKTGLHYLNLRRRDTYYVH